MKIFKKLNYYLDKLLNYISNILFKMDSSYENSSIAPFSEDEHQFAPVLEDEYQFAQISLNIGKSISAVEVNVYNGKHGIEWVFIENQGSEHFFHEGHLTFKTAFSNFCRCSQNKLRLFEFTLFEKNEKITTETLLNLTAENVFELINTPERILVQCTIEILSYN